MNKTYNDIDAVSRLLEEKENDLELAARIGQGLLEKNKELSLKADALEEALDDSTEKISQLRHELSLKDALLQTYSDDYESECVVAKKHNGYESHAYSATLEQLQKKTKELERENQSLKAEVAEIISETDSLEYKEQNLVEECVRQFEEANEQVKLLQDELAARSEKLQDLDREINELTKANVAYACKSDKLAEDNESLQKQLEVSQVLHAELATKWEELQEKYEECEALLLSTQQEVKALRNHAHPNVVHQHYGPAGMLYVPDDSLAMELQRSRAEQDFPEGYGPKQRRKHLDRVMETARSVRHSQGRTVSEGMSSVNDPDLHTDLGLLDGGEHLSISSPPHHVDPLLLLGKSRPSFDTESLVSEATSGPGANSEDWKSALDKLLLERRTLGKPGIPGSKDLEAALRRLNTAQHALSSSDTCLLEAVQRQFKTLHINEDPATTTASPCESSYTDDSGVDYMQSSKTFGLAFSLPERLQIVKPLEGSLTLHQWKRLAQPRLEHLLEHRPGVTVRGEPPVVEQAEVYSLADIEEDDDVTYVQKLGSVAKDVNKLTWKDGTSNPDVQVGKHNPSSDAASKKCEPAQGETGSEHTQDDSRKQQDMSLESKTSRTSKLKTGVFHVLRSLFPVPVASLQVEEQPQQAEPEAEHQPEVSCTQSCSYQSSEYKDIAARLRAAGLERMVGSMVGNLNPLKCDPLDVGLNSVKGIRDGVPQGAVTRGALRGNITPATSVESATTTTYRHCTNRKTNSPLPRLERNPLTSVTSASCSGTCDMGSMKPKNLMCGTNVTHDVTVLMPSQHPPTLSSEAVFLYKLDSNMSSRKLFPDYHTESDCVISHNVITSSHQHNRHLHRQTRLLMPLDTSTPAKKDPKSLSLIRPVRKVSCDAHGDRFFPDENMPNVGTGVMHKGQITSQQHVSKCLQTEIEKFGL